MKHIHTFENFLNEGLNESALDRISKADQESIMQILKKIAERYRGSYVKTLFDYQQTHGLYGLSTDTVDQAKKDLADIGAKKFRIVKNGGLPIICFDASAIKK